MIPISKTGSPCLRSAKTRLLVTVAILFVMAGAVTIGWVNRQMKAHTLAEAKAKAKLMLDRNLAIHTYFSHELKPAVFQAMAAGGVEPDFNPAWMSSTYAVRQMETMLKSLSDVNYYYKECAINARHPDNEADAYENAFLRRLNQDSRLEVDAAVRLIGNDHFYTVLRRAETMAQTCLRCHSRPELAPTGLVETYGPERSFDRTLGETVSAISIRIPLEAAYAQADRLSLQLASFFAALLVILYGVVATLTSRWILAPLDMVTNRVGQIASDPALLGEQLQSPAIMEIRPLVSAFNTMSAQLLAERSGLEQRVTERTEQLQAANDELSQANGRHRQTIARLEETLKEVKQLRGILPICSYCKKIRDDAGFWNQVEEYLAEHSDAEFSHSICPACMASHFPGIDVAQA